MRILIESLKRLHEKGNVSKEDIERMFSENKITEDEKKYILNEG